MDVSRQVRANQGGSVLSFIIVAVVLLLVVVGNIYFVRRGSAPTQTTKEHTATQSPHTTSTSPKRDKVTTPPANTSQNTPQAASEPHQTATVLPQTGPTETLMSAIIMAMLAGAIVSYGRSKRSLLSL